MRVSLSILSLITPALGVIITQTITNDNVCWINVPGPTITSTVPGVTATVPSPGTTTVTETILIIPGFGTYTEIPTPAPKARAVHPKTTIIEVEVCAQSSTLTVYPTATITASTLTAYNTCYAHTTTVTTTTTEQLG